MKKLLLFTFLFSFIFNVHAQDDDNGIEFHSVSVSPLNFYFANRDGGFGVNLDVAFNKGKHIFKVYAGGAIEAKLDILGVSPKDQFLEFNVMYGRELNIVDWFGIDFYAGAGYFDFTYDKFSSGEYNEGTIGFPLQSKIRFNTGRIFSLGIQLHSNINSATIIYHPGIFVQVKI